MSIRGDKAYTKDVDLVFATEEEVEVFIRALEEAGFEAETDLTNTYLDLGARVVMVAKDGFWIDIFLERIAKKLYLSDGVKARAENWGSMGKLKLKLCSQEDIFLSKSVTDRERDLEDMMVLYRKVLDPDVLFEECDTQTENSEKIWHLFLAKKIDEMEEKYEVTVPWKEELVEIGGRMLLERKVPDLVADGPSTVAQIAERYEVEEDLVKRVLTELEDKGVIKVDRKRRPNLYLLDDG